MTDDRKTFAALLRGINVGGGRKIEMAKLRAVCGNIGLENVQTYIQSGNVAFTADASPTALEGRLEDAIGQEFRFAVSVVVRSQARWKHYVRTNPFADESRQTPNLVILAVSKSAVKGDSAKALEQRATQGERVVADRDALWIYYPGGIARSKLSPTVLDRLVDSAVTTRNWRTVHALDRMLHGIRSAR